MWMIQPTPHASARAGEYPENPVLCRVWRGGAVESQHRGAWVMVDSSGAVLQGAGAIHAPVFARSSIKSLQALPLIESGAAEAFGLSDEELALCIASHSGEALHVERVRGMLARKNRERHDTRYSPTRSNPHSDRPKP